MMSNNTDRTAEVYGPFINELNIEASTDRDPHSVRKARGNTRPTGRNDRRKNEKLNTRSRES
ncbi:hypothetical protein N0Y54_11250 [Nostoc punctiforme UO1]|uniref:hypothetical protein n=1 Tax=Nostoc punctiforme TaxID=272131 RepID=UPI0030A401B8